MLIQKESLPSASLKRPRYSGSSPLLLSALLIFQFISPSLNQPVSAKPATKTLARKELGKPSQIRFPSDRRYGHLQILKLVEGKEPYNGKKLRQLPARGTISIPDGCVVKWEPDYETGTHLETLRNLNTDSIVSLNLGKLPLTAKQLAGLSQFKNLYDLRLDNTDVSDAGVAILIKSGKIRRLNLGSTKITAKSIQLLTKLPNLKDLVVQYNVLSDSVKDSLPNIRKLEELNLSRTGIGDQTIMAMGRLKNLTDIDLSDNKKVTNRGIASLSSLPRLRQIILSNTGVTPAVSKILKKFPSLEGIKFNRQDLKPGELEKMQAELPKVKIKVNKPRLSPDLFGPLH